MLIITSSSTVVSSSITERSKMCDGVTSLLQHPLEGPDFDDLVGAHRDHQVPRFVHVQAAYLLAHLVELGVGRLPK